jgi:cell division protein FtsB
MDGILRRKKKVRRLLFSRLSIILLLILVFFVGRATWRMYEKAINTRADLALVEAHYNDLESRERELSEKLKELNTEKGVEREIRDTYGVVKENEGVIILVEEEEEDEVKERENNKDFPWWKKLFNTRG